MAVGLFDIKDGLFYGGGVHLLGIQCLGVISVGIYTAIFMGIIFTVMDKIWGLRVSAEEELTGLDLTEHGLPSAYADFMPAGNMFYSAGTSIETLTGNAPTVGGNVVIKTSENASAMKVVTENGMALTNKLTRISIICKQSKFDELKEALNAIGVMGLTVTQVLGCGTQKGMTTRYRGAELDIVLLPKMKVEVVVSAVPVQTVIDTAKKVLYTGSIGDGKIFVYDVENVVKVRTGEEGFDALQGESE